MNHGGLGVLTASGRLLLPPNLLDRIALSSGSVLSGVYYPSEFSPQPNPGSSIIHDFMFTPVPSRFWDRCARFVIRLNHKPGSLRRVAEFLRDNKVSILHAESTRSGHRYATWSLHVIFEAVEPGRFDANRSVYRGTLKAKDSLQKTLCENCSDVLFRDDKDIDLCRSVESYPHTALAYFSNFSNTSAAGGEQTRWKYRDFKVQCTNQGVICTDKTLLSNIVGRVGMDTGVDLYPTIVFANVDTRYLNMRVGLIPRERIDRFFEVYAQYVRRGEPDTCVGVIETLAERLGEQCNMWRLYNYAVQSTREGEAGEIVLLAEDCSVPDRPRTRDAASMARDRMNERSVGPKPTHIDFPEINVYPVTIESVEARFREQVAAREPYKYDVFVSYDDNDRAYAEQITDALKRAGLWVFLAKRELGTGKRFNEETRKAIRDSREMCVLCTTNSVRSLWVATEWGAAWVLGREIVPICLQIAWDDLPPRLGELHGVQFSELEEYVEAVGKRRRLQAYGITGRGDSRSS